MARIMGEKRVPTTDASARAAVPTRAVRRRRAMTWSLVIILTGAMVLPLTGYLWAAMQPVLAQAAQESNPRANFWEAVREGVSGYSAVSGQEANVLIQNGGQNWRQLRNGPIAVYGGWFLFLVLVAILAFFAIRGRVQLEKGRSGVTVERWKLWERVMHWFTATLFVILAITGLSMLFGRAVLIPLLGPQGFASWASLSMSLHNYLGPVFSIGVLCIIVFWMKNNLPSKEDWEWFRQGGGIIGKKHPSAGKANAGEKVWFWIVCVFGLAVIISGFILDFPNYGQSRETMQTANLVHGIAALVWIAVFFGHAYIGTLGTEGALEGMTRGRVDKNWAIQHHDLWYEEVEDTERKEPERDAGGVPREQPT